MTVESKQEAIFEFCIDDQPEPHAGPFDGVIHLFGHTYNEKVLFWYGVAQVNCSYVDTEKVMVAGKPTDFRIVVQLRDGRRGMAREIHAHFEGVKAGYTEIAMIGWTPLAVL